MTVPVVTALRARGRDRVSVELDGAPWRTVPLEAMYIAGLAVGRPLDRPSARALGRELRRLEARGIALRALRARDHTAASLEQRLHDRGTAAGVRRETIEAAQRSGLVDDRRFAYDRAELLAQRGSGDLLIEDDLERHGVPGALVRAARRRAGARIGACRQGCRGAWHERENSSLPGGEGILRGDPRIDRCRSGCRRVRIGMLHPTFHLHRAHSENRPTLNIHSNSNPTCGMTLALRRARRPR